MDEWLPIISVSIATALAFIVLVPQVVRLWKTRNVHGISIGWITLGIISNSVWLIYLSAQELYLALPATIVTIAAYLLLLWGWWRSTHSMPWKLLTWATLWGVAQLAVAVIGGWAALAVVLGVAPLVQAIPAVRGVYATKDVSGVAPATWWIGQIEMLAWVYYGIHTNDTALILFPIVWLLAGAAILTRYYWLNYTQPKTEPAQH